MSSNLLDRRRMMCVNCGKIVSEKTLVCDACGTDYREKPECDHVYDKWDLDNNPAESYCSNLYLKCGKCGEIIKLKCDPYMLRDMAANSHYFRGLI